MRVDPGKRATPAHGHAAEEELVYVLGGAGLSWQGGETFEIGAGDFIVHLPRSRAHTLLAGVGASMCSSWAPTSTPRSATCRAPRSPGSAIPGRRAGDGEHPWAREIACGDLPLPAAPSARPRHIVNVRDVEAQPKAVGDTERVRRDLGTAAGAVSCGLQHVTVAAGKIGCPPHVHSAEEEAS